jgi:hypothetical protein
MMSPDQLHDIFVTASMQHGLDVAHPISSHTPMVTEIFTRSTTEMTQWIADATATSVDASTQDDGGWWKAYINIFKSILTFVHSTVDGPLRSIGIEQTWGVSIFLFTASELKSSLYKAIYISKMLLTLSLIPDFLHLCSHPVIPFTFIDPTIEKCRIHESATTIHE